MQRSEVAKYVRELKGLNPQVQAVITSHSLVPKGEKITSPAAERALIAMLADRANSGTKDAQARAILYVLEDECGLGMPIIIDALCNVKTHAAA